MSYIMSVAEPSHRPFARSVDATELYRNYPSFSCCLLYFSYFSSSFPPSFLPSFLPSISICFQQLLVRLNHYHAWEPQKTSYSCYKHWQIKFRRNSQTTKGEGEARRKTTTNTTVSGKPVRAATMRVATNPDTRITD